MRLFYAIFFVLLFVRVAVADIYVPVGDVLTGTIDISETTRIENHGKILATFNVSSGPAITFLNYGTFSGYFNITGTTAHFIQEIPDNGAVNKIEHLSGHKILIEDASYINMKNLIDIAVAAANIELTASSFIVETGISLTGVEIKVIDNVTFRITGAYDDETIPLLTNVLGSPEFEVVGFDSMYRVIPRIESRNLYVHRERATNYSLILGGGRGQFLDDLRIARPDDKFLGALDAAQTRAELNGVLARSVRTNPAMMAMPMRTVVMHDDGYAFNDTGAGVAFSPFYLMASDLSLVGGNINFSGTVSENIFGYVGGVFGRLNFDNDLDEYSGMLYGGRLGAVYNDGDFYAAARGLVMNMATDDLDVFDGASVVHNPSAMVADMVADFGLVFKVLSDIDLASFVGVRADYAKVLNQTESELTARVGIETMAKTVQDGNNYGIGLRAVMETDGTFLVSGRTGIMSNADGIGIGLDIGAVHDDIGWSIRLMLDAKAVF